MAAPLAVRSATDGMWLKVVYGERARDAMMSLKVRIVGCIARLWGTCGGLSLLGHALH